MLYTVYFICQAYFYIIVCVFSLSITTVHHLIKQISFCLHFVTLISVKFVIYMSERQFNFLLSALVHCVTPGLSFNVYFILLS